MNDLDGYEPFERVLVRWAARKLDVELDAIANVEIDWWGLCDTCEFSAGEIDVTLKDGSRYEGRERFGLFLRDIVEMDINDDGTMRHRGSEPFDLVMVSGPGEITADEAA